MKLSIITINRNNAQGLRKTIESVVSQTFTDFEYIVIDGASTDGSVEVIKEFSNHIHYWVSEPDKGIYNAMNKGIVKAKGEYCFFLNSGDWLYSKDSIKIIFSMRFCSDIVAGNISKESEIVVSPNELTLRNLLIRNIPHQAMFIKKDLFYQYQMYDEELNILSDFLFNILMSLKDVSYQYINVIVSNYDTTGISSDDKQYQILLKEQDYVIKKTLPASIANDYAYFLNKKTLNHPAIHWLIHNKILFKFIKGLNLIFNKKKDIYA